MFVLESYIFTSFILKNPFYMREHKGVICCNITINIIYTMNNNIVNKIIDSSDEDDIILNEIEDTLFDNYINNEMINIDSLMYKLNPSPLLQRQLTPSPPSPPSPVTIKEEWIVKEHNEPYPKLVFIIPYRDREREKHFFQQRMTTILEKKYPKSYYKIYYIHQTDNKPFNRGAMKNIGFLMVKNSYPNDYKNITLVFNDVDTTPMSHDTIPDFTTIMNKVKHFYGYTFALGGIVSIMAGDFERINGFPNYYSWGFEDNELNARVLKAGMTIDRSVFFNINDTQNILQIQNGKQRTVNRGEFDRFVKQIKEGINSIKNLNYNIDETEGIGMVNVKMFETTYQVNENLNSEYDITKGMVPFKVGYSSRRRSTMNLVI